MDTRTINEVKENLLKCIEKLSSNNGFCTDNSKIYSNIVEERFYYLVNKFSNFDYATISEFADYPVGKCIFSINYFQDYISIRGDIDCIDDYFYIALYRNKFSFYYKCKGNILEKILNEYILKYGVTGFLKDNIETILNFNNEERNLNCFDMWYIVKENIDIWEDLYKKYIDSDRKCLVYNCSVLDNFCFNVRHFYEIYDFGDINKLICLKISINFDYNVVEFYNGWINRKHYTKYIQKCKEQNDFYPIKINNLFDYNKYKEKLNSKKEIKKSLFRKIFG